MQSAPVELLPEHTKRNARGNRIYSEERKRELVEEWRASGLTQKAFARKTGVKYGTLTSWTCKPRSVRKPTAAVAFEELAIRSVSKVEPVDMRKQFNGLWALTREKLEEDPKSGALFVFTNKDRDRLKILYWDGTGMWVLAKRLEKGRFSWPQSGRGQAKLSLTAEALGMLTGGIDLKSGMQKAWYER